MADYRPVSIVRRRGGNPEEGHHGGAWKIAFADFMTAMMAFFLVLWIINAKDPKQLLARYFDIVRIEDPEKTPMRKSLAMIGETPASKYEDKSQHLEAAPEESEPAAHQPTMPEDELFRDPYQSLDKIASGDARPAGVPRVDIGPTDPTRTAGPMTTDSFLDPFKPIGPRANDNSTLDAGELPAAASSGDIEPEQSIPTKQHATDEPSKPPKVAEGPNAAAAAADGTAQPRHADAAAKLLKQLQDQLGALAKSSPGPAIDVQSTDEGLLISLTDRMNFSMFAVGSAEPNPAVVRAMESIGKILWDRPGDIVVRGHTDGRAYRSPTYDNWRLSSARAQMAYYMLTRAGVPEARFGRVVGCANRSLKDPAHPLAAENRRIEIVLHTAKP